MPAPITLTGFAGSSLAQDARELPEQVGVNAVDMEPGRDRFVPLQGRTTTATVPAGRLSLHRMNRAVADAANYWLSWSQRVNAALFFGDTTLERTLFTGNGFPKWTDNVMALGGGAPYPQAWRDLGVPPPGATAPNWNNAGGKPTVVLTTPGTEGTEALRYYAYTFVNDLGWESAPSIVSDGLLCKPGSVVTISNVAAPYSGNWGTITAKRIYVTQPDNGNNAEFFFLREVSAATTSTTDDARARGDLMPTNDGSTGSSWLPPPADGFGVIALWNGMHAMLSAQKLHYCEPEAPYAWPVKYDRPLEHKPVAQGKWGQNHLVLTAGRPVIYQGQDPGGMTPLPAQLWMPCRSAAGVVSFPDGVAFPSSDGLGWVGETGSLNLTKGLLTPTQWNALNPSSMVAGMWRGLYVCSYDSGGGVLKGFMLNPSNPTGIYWLSSGFDACHYDDFTQTLFVLEGTNVRSFGTGAPLTATFTGKKFLQTFPRQFGFLKVIADAYPVTVKVTATGRDKNGALRTHTETRSVPSDRVCTLKAGFSAEEWQPEVTSAAPVTVLRLAIDPDDFKGT